MEWWEVWNDGKYGMMGSMENEREEGEPKDWKKHYTKVIISSKSAD